MIDRPTVTPIQQLVFYLKNGLPTPAIRAWIESLPKAERQEVEGELGRITLHIVSGVTGVDHQEYGRNIANGIADGLTDG